MTGNVSGGIQYKSHVQDVGWQTSVSNNALSGTTGKSLRVEAIQIDLTGNLKSQYDIYYRSQIQDRGWLGWAKNGESSGTQGLSLRLESIQVKLVKKVQLLIQKVKLSLIPFYQSPIKRMFKIKGGNTLLETVLLVGPLTNN